MTLNEQIGADITAAMKAKDATRLSALRMLKAAVMNRSVEKKADLSDAEVLQVVASLVKQRRDSIEQFTAAGRTDLVAKETGDLAVLERYLPPAATAEEIEETPDVGPTVAASIRKFLDDSRNIALIRQLLEAGIEFKAPERKGDELAGQVIVFTGGLERISRDEAKALAQAHGAKTADSVSKTVTLVVAGPGAGSKLDKANKLGIKVVDEGAFLKMVGR